MTKFEKAEPGSDGPVVSVIMANWQGERYLDQAIASVLAQTEGRLELLIADDASNDRSAEIARSAACQDARVIFLATDRNAGPADARNRALAAAKGEWVAIVDSDDLMHPRRLELLLSAALRLNVDMVADDLAFFGNRPGLGGRTLLGSLGLAGALEVTPELLVRSDVEPELPRFGYLKPLIRRSSVQDLVYDTRLKVSEDFDLYLRLLLRGAKFAILPLPLYLYRRHAASLSHRLSVPVLEAVLLAQAELEAELTHEDPALWRALRIRRKGLARALRYEHLVEAIKARSVGRGLGQLLRDPPLLRNLARSVSERLSRPKPTPDLQTVSASHVILLPEGRELPEPLRPSDKTMEALAIRSDDLSAGPRLHALSVQLTNFAAQAAPDVIAVGREGLDTLGLLPAWRSAELWLEHAEIEDLIRVLPAGVAIRKIGR